MLSHFKRIDRYISKEDVLKELCREFQKNGLGNYEKNDKNIFDKVTNDDWFDNALKNCEFMENLNCSGNSSQRNPMTKVYKIVEGLKDYLK